ncbi:MAG: VCBS repeat-containing protein [Hyphomicrobiales bacterium]|nr:MAG: VCBS repeat-containing protein [Hyphomicrobiales bacterium]
MAAACTALILGFLCTPEAQTDSFLDVTAEALPAKDPRLHSMAASAADIDNDGDLDLVIAVEFGTNRLLLNDGTGRFTDASASLPPHPPGDHEDVAIADFDGNGQLDLAFYGEDDQIAALFLNQGGLTFIEATARLPSRGIANAVVAADIDGDGDADLIVGNAGPDFVLINDGAANFTDESDRLPVGNGITQDIATGDVNGDGTIDLLFGNEDGNALYFNDGIGGFHRERLPSRPTPEETRDADFVDIDGDGDLDIYFANVEIFVPDRDRQDRLLLNDGHGIFADVTATHLPAETETTMAAAFIDLDGDGDLDIVRGGFDLSRTRDPVTPLIAWLNDGAGYFAAATGAIPATALANTFDLEVADYNGDGVDDLFVASRGGADRLLLGLARR